MNDSEIDRRQNQKLDLSAQTPEELETMKTLEQ